MKRFISFIIICAVLLCSFPAPISAAGEVFVATNNIILPLTDTMPIKSGGAWYVDYNCFTSGDLKVSSSYNADSKTLVLYTWETTLVFNLDKHTAYNTKDNIQHSQKAFSSRGTFYVPAQFTASQLGITYSYIDSASCIRFRSTSTLTDSMFAYIVKSKTPELISQYNASKKPESNKQQQNQVPSTPNNSQTTVQKRVFLTFDIRSGERNSEILSTLSKYKMKATFFLSENSMLANDDTIRRMVVDGHEIGISDFSDNSQSFSSPEAMISQLKKTNNLLYEIARIKSHLVRVPNGSNTGFSSQCADALINSGYRYWDWTINANASSRISSNVINALNKQSYAVIRFTDSPETVAALGKILDYLKDNNCVVSTLSVLDTPTNQRNDRR